MHDANLDTEIVNVFHFTLAMSLTLTELFLNCLVLIEVDQVFIFFQKEIFSHISKELQTNAIVCRIRQMVAIKTKSNQ